MVREIKESFGVAHRLRKWPAAYSGTPSCFSDGGREPHPTFAGCTPQGLKSDR